MDTWQQITEQNIIEYITNIDFKNPDFSINDVKKELKKIIGSEPNVKIKWSENKKINELLKQSGVKEYTETIEKAEQIDIIYLNTDNKPISLKVMF